MIDRYDYYVSGIKIHTQVPRFTAPMRHQHSVHERALDALISTHDAVVLAFYPYDFTPEAQTFLNRLAASANQHKDVAFVALSSDSDYAHKVFLETCQHVESLYLIGNPALDIGEAYGVLDEDQGSFKPALFRVEPSGLLTRFQQAERLSELNIEALL